MLKFISGNCLYYLSKVCQFAPEGNISLRDDFFKLNRPFWNTNTSQKALFFIGPSFWNQIPETLKKENSLNTFKHNLERHFFNQMIWFLTTTSITWRFHLFILWQSGCLINTFCHKIYIFDFHLLETILKVKSTCKTIITLLLKIKNYCLQNGYHGYAIKIIAKTLI